MITKKGVFTIGFIILTLCLIQNIPAEESHIATQKITITELNDSYQIKETSSYIINQTEQFPLYIFEIPATAKDVKIYIENIVVNNPIISTNTYQINLSNLNITSTEISIEVTYYLSSSTTIFSKTIQNKIDNLEITFDNKKILTISNVQQDTPIELLLAKTTVESFSIYAIILIALLIIIIGVTTWYGFFKRKNGKTRQRNYESSELLETEKSLLLNILKEIEKMHRNNKLSDDSYHKLKSHYKQQTVEIMSALEETTSK